MGEPVATGLTTILVSSVVSSAVISALVNVAWNAYSSRQVRAREDAKEEHKVGHVYLGLVLKLDRFARLCHSRLYEISDAIETYRETHSSDAMRDMPPMPPIFDPASDWSALPIAYVARLETLLGRYEQCDSWIKEQFVVWAELDEAWEIECERLAFYGLAACKLATDTRALIKAGNEEFVDVIKHFESVINSRRTYLRDNPQRAYTIIPELRAQLEAENCA
jgi:hypothetical protein